MRTTVTLADDVAAAVQQVMQRDGVGRSEAVNSLVRAGLAHQRPRASYAARMFPLGVRIDVSDVGEVLDLLDQWDSAGGPEARGAR